MHCHINNPCELNGYFTPPNYNCFQLTNDVICTCPDGQAVTNARCRKTYSSRSKTPLFRWESSGVCDRINCGPNGICYDRVIFPGVFFFCGCSNGTGSYARPGPCPGPITSTTTASTTTTTITTTTTTVVTTFSPISCVNGGKGNHYIIILIFRSENLGAYNPTTGQCSCPIGFIGPQCEVSDGKT